MREIGFSSGALSKSDFRTAIELLRGEHITAIELSALRMEELEPLVLALPTLVLESFSYVSLHVPSSFPEESEEIVLHHLGNATKFIHSF